MSSLSPTTTWRPDYREGRSRSGPWYLRPGRCCGAPPDRDDCPQRASFPVPRHTRIRVASGDRPEGDVISPRWAAVGSCSLYFYGSERHMHPHVDVRGPGFKATLDVSTGEVLAGAVPPRELRMVRELLAEHRGLALEAFYRTLDHDFPGTLEQQLKDRS